MTALGTTTSLDPLYVVPPPQRLRRFTVAQYHQMIRNGWFSEDESCELLEGWVVAKMSRNPPHDVCLDLTTEQLRNVLPKGWRVRGQSAITTSDSEPEPDIAVVRGGPRDFLQAHPRPADIALVIEIADSTLASDRDLKLRIYARAAIPSYWIINLIDRQIEVHTSPTGPAVAPTYRHHTNYASGQRVPLVLDGVSPGDLLVDDLLP